MPAGRLGKKHDKERNEPLKPFRALIEFDLHAKLVFNDDFQVLLIDPYAQLVGFSLVFAWNPDLPDRLGQIDARRIELIGAVVQLIAVFLQRGLVGGIGLGRFAQVRQLARGKAEQLQQAIVAVVVLRIIEKLLLGSVGEVPEVNERPDAKIVVEQDEDRDLAR